MSIYILHSLNTTAKIFPIIEICIIEFYNLYPLNYLLSSLKLGSVDKWVNMQSFTSSIYTFNEDHSNSKFGHFLDRAFQIRICLKFLTCITYSSWSVMWICHCKITWDDRSDHISQATFHHRQHAHKICMKIVCFMLT